MNRTLKALANDIARKTKLAKGLIIPVSGGSDSALCFWLLNQVYPEKTLGVYAGSRENLRCADWFHSNGTIQYVAHPLCENKQEAEIFRWAEFLKIAVIENRWLVGARNKTESVFGTYSHASCVATYLPLARVWKTTVMELCAACGVPQEIIASSSKADPACGRPLELAEIPIEVIDGYLMEKIGGKLLPSVRLPDETQRLYLDGIYDYNRFKAKLPQLGARIRPR